MSAVVPFQKAYYILKHNCSVITTTAVE
uniref:Uncharacterized protein n=1 Tax=Anguilla anguilla TaxID=7936 RepID=A0A0E9S9Y8_ANGAN